MASFDGSKLSFEYDALIRSPIGKGCTNHASFGKPLPDSRYDSWSGYLTNGICQSG